MMPVFTVSPKLHLLRNEIKKPIHSTGLLMGSPSRSSRKISISRRKAERSSKGWPCLDAAATIWLPLERVAKYTSAMPSPVETTLPSTRTCRRIDLQRKRTAADGFSANSKPLRQPYRRRESIAETGDRYFRAYVRFGAVFGCNLMKPRRAIEAISIHHRECRHTSSNARSASRSG